MTIFFPPEELLKMTDEFKASRELLKRIFFLSFFFFCFKVVGKTKTKRGALANLISLPSFCFWPPDDSQWPLPDHMMRSVSLVFDQCRGSHGAEDVRWSPH